MMEKNSDIINTCQRGQKIDEHTIKWRYWSRHTDYFCNSC